MRFQSCLAFSLLCRAGLDPSASPNEIKCSKAMALQDYGNLEGPARDFAEHKGLGPHDLDEYGWTLLHYAVKESQDTQGMIPVVKGLVPEMSDAEVNARTTGGKPRDWCALSICCNSRDEANERITICKMLIDARADLEMPSANGATPLLNACASGFWSVVEILLDAGADTKARNNNGKNALDVTPPEKTQVI